MVGEGREVSRFKEQSPNDVRWMGTNGQVQNIEGAPTRQCMTLVMYLSLQSFNLLQARGRRHASDEEQCDLQETMIILAHASKTPTQLRRLQYHHQSLK